MIFYRFLSEKIEEQAQILLAEDNIDYETAMADEDYRPVLEPIFSLKKR
jgi:type I restriction enzyme M protein